MTDTFKKLVTEYKSWIAKDSLSALRYVRPSLAENIRGLMLTNGKDKVTIFEKPHFYRQPNFQYLDQVKKIKSDEIDDYFSVRRMDTLEPWKMTTVGWPLYEYPFRVSEEKHKELSGGDQLTLALLEMGLHESLEWITVTELGIPDRPNKLDENFMDFPLWPHDDHYNQYILNRGKFWAEAKFNNDWYRLTVSF